MLEPPDPAWSPVDLPPPAPKDGPAWRVRDFVAALWHPVRFAEIPAPYRSAATAAVACLVAACVLLVRPIGWRQVGGTTLLWDGFTVSTLSVLGFGLLLAGLTALCTWACLASKRPIIRWGALAFVPIPVILAIVARTQVRLLVPESGEPPEDPLAVLTVIVGGLPGLVAPVALIALVFAAILSPDSAGVRAVAAAAVGAVGAIPTVLFAFVLLLPDERFPLLRDGGGVETFAGAMAGGIIVELLFAAFLVGFYAALQAGGAAHEAADLGAGSAMRPKTVRVGLAALAIAKLSISVAGFSGYLPNAIGGDFPGWGQGGVDWRGWTYSISWDVWLLTILWTIPALALVAWSLRQRGSGARRLGGWIIGLCIILELPALAEFLLRPIATFVPSLGFPTLEDPLFIEGVWRSAVRLIGLLILVSLAAGSRSPDALRFVSFALVLSVPSLMRGLLAVDLGVPNALQLDAVASVVALVIVAVERLHRFAPAALAYLVGSSVMLFLGVFIPHRPDFLPFGAGVAALAFWLLLVRGQGLNRAVQTDPAEVVLAAAVPALLITLLWSQKAAARVVGYDVGIRVEGFTDYHLTGIGVPIVLAVSIGLAATLEHGDAT